MEDMTKISVAVAAVAFTLVAMYSAVLIRKDTLANEKRFRTITLFVFIASAMAYLLAMYYFRADATYELYFLMAVVCLIILPATLVSVSVATIVGGN
jgi:hypothetical protein